jgi:hypothetical protein
MLIYEVSSETVKERVRYSQKASGQQLSHENRRVPYVIQIAVI